MFDTKLLGDYLTIYNAGPGWRQALRHYRIQNVLVEPATPIAQVLAQEPGWRLAYHDHTAVLFTVR